MLEERAFMNREQELEANLEVVREKIELACQRAGRARADVTLVAVSKTFPLADIEVVRALGVADFGESYIQEWREKVESASDGLRWHLIGHLQSNKVKYIRGRAALVHSVDRASLLRELDKRSEPGAEILLQVNVGRDANKSGADPEQVIDLLDAATAAENLRVVGLMTIPPITASAEEARPFFKALREARELCLETLDARGLLDRHPCQHLSMGMSSDYVEAIEEGATIVRVGSSIFGRRSYAV